MKKRKVQIKSCVIVLLCLILGCFTNVYGYSATGNKLNTNYTLSGNGAEDIYAVAKAQLGKKYTEFSGFTYRAWCADFVSACAAAANVSDVIPGTAAVSNLRSNIVNAGGTEYSKAQVQNGSYTPVRGDIIIFKSNGDSHVGIVDKAENGSIYYIDGNNTVYGNGNNASVHYSNRAYSYAGFTCVIRPKYRSNPDPTPSPIPIPQGSQTISDGEYHIVSGLDSSKALDVYGASKDNAANIQIYSNLSDGRETFHITYLGNGAYKIINSNSGRCLDVDGAGMEAGTNVQQYDYVGADQQQWIIQEDNGWFNIISKKNGLYLDVKGGDSSNEANVQVWNKNGSDAQRWRFVAWGKNVGETVSEGRYHIVSALDGATKGLDVYCGEKDSGANIQIYDNLDDDSQTFELTYLGEGYYKIINTNSGKSLDVESADTKKGSNIQQYGYVGANQQIWVIKESSGGWFNIISKHNGLCLDVDGGVADNNRNVQGWICNDSDAQKWRFIACGSDDGQTISDDEYHIVSALDEKQGLDVENCSKDDGANIQLYPNTWDARETFRVSYLGKGYYKIINSYSGKSLDVTGADTSCGTNLQQYGYKGVNQQQWILRKTSDGYYKIISKASGLCVDVENGAAANNANVWMWTGNETKAQKWKFIPLQKDISNYDLNLSKDTYSYDGKEKTPDVVVKNGTDLLTKDEDYSVSYADNINAGTATVTVDGIGKYTGKITKEFRIDKASQELTVSVDKTNISIGETVQIKADGQGQITYESSVEDKVAVSSDGMITGKQAGEAIITVTASGTQNYNSATEKLTINVQNHNWDANEPTLSLVEKNGILVTSVANTAHVTEYGFVYGKQTDVTLETPGRTRIVYSELNADGSYSLDIAELTGCTIRAYAVYIDENGKEQVVYSNPIAR